MNLYYSLERVPELSGLGKNQRLVALMYYHANKTVTPGCRIAENALVGMVIFAEIAGLVGGFAFFYNSFWGPILGATIALALVMCAFYFGTLYVEAPKFRRFLQADHSQFLLRCLDLPSAAPTSAPASREAAAHASRDFGTHKTSMSEGQRTEALRRVGYGAARSSEMMEFSEELAKQTLQLFHAVQQKQEEGWRALRSLKLGKFFQLSRETVALRCEAFRLLRQSGELLHRAETALGGATALLTQIQKESEL